MSHFVGVAPFSELNLADVKQEALLFDQIAVPGLLEILDDSSSSDEVEHGEICWLAEKGVLFPATAIVDERKAEELKRIEGLVEEPNIFTRLVAEQLRTEFAIDAVALESTVPLNYRKFSFQPQLDDRTFITRAYCRPSRPDFYPPILEELFQIHQQGSGNVTPDWVREYAVPAGNLLGPVLGNGSVVDVVLKRFPYIAEDTSWEQILEFRDDPNSKLRRSLLRRWMGGFAEQHRNPVEIEQEIDCLLAEYEEHMRVHKMVINHGVLRTVVVGTATVLEDVVKLKWGKIAESLFSLSERRALLMKEELKAPGRELSYLIAVRSFSEVE